MYLFSLSLSTPSILTSLSRSLSLPSSLAPSPGPFSLSLPLSPPSSHLLPHFPPLLYIIWLPFHYYLPSASDHRVILALPTRAEWPWWIDDVLFLVVQVMSTNYQNTHSLQTDATLFSAQSQTVEYVMH